MLISCHRNELLNCACFCLNQVESCWIKMFLLQLLASTQCCLPFSIIHISNWKCHACFYLICLISEVCFLITVPNVVNKIISATLATKDLGILFHSQIIAWKDNWIFRINLITMKWFKKARYGNYAEKNKDNRGALNKVELKI